MDRKWVRRSRSDAPTGLPEQGVGAQRHGRVGGVVEMEHGQAQGRKTDHECCLDERLKFDTHYKHIDTQKSLNKKVAFHSTIFIVFVNMTTSHSLKVKSILT